MSLCFKYSRLCGLWAPKKRPVPRRRVWRGAILGFGLLVFFAGCAASRPQSVSPATAVREDFDPQTLNDDGFLLKMPASHSAPSPSVQSVSPTEAASPVQTTAGYRVQIAAVLDRVGAQTFRAQAQEQLNVPVYVQHDKDTGLYKIQAGNFQTAEKAEQLREKVRLRGYREAFVVHTRIETSPAPVHRPATVPGYRIQIFSASSQEAAEQVQAQARTKLGRQDVYIEFEPPFFKVRIGNFRTQKEAEAQLRTVKQHGYDTPFVVQTKILASPE